MKKRIKKSFTKMQTKLSDGSMDSYHLKAMFFCLVPLILLIISLIESCIIALLIAIHTGIAQLYIEPLILLFFVFMHVYISYFILKKFREAFKQKYYMLSLIIFFVLATSAIITILWIFIFKISLLNLLIVLFHMPNKLQFPYKNIKLLINIICKSSLFMFIFYPILGVSYILNGILPNSLQKKNIPIKDRLKRMAMKFSAIGFILFITIIFAVINKDNFSSVTIFTTLFTFVCTPQMILRVFSGYKNVENLEVSGDILRTFDYIKLLYYECLFSWAISIYIFEAQDTNEKLTIFAISIIILLSLTIVVQQLLIKFNKRVFSNWIVPKTGAKYKITKGEQKYNYKVTKK